MLAGLLFVIVGHSSAVRNRHTIVCWAAILSLQLQMAAMLEAWLMLLATSGTEGKMVVGKWVAKQERNRGVSGQGWEGQEVEQEREQVNLAPVSSPSPSS